VTTAFVLSGGASLGAIQAGMLSALYERGIAPDLIVGTSVGAVNGAFIASRPPSVETAEALAGVWKGVSRSEVFPLHPLTGFIGFIGQRPFLIPDRGLRRLLERHVEISSLEAARIPLHVIATDVFSGEERRLSRGPAVEAILASAAIPAVFPPVDWNGTQLVDGGVSNNTPITHALELGADRVYVLPTGHSCALEEAPRGALAMLVHALNLLVTRRLIIEIELLRDSANLIVLPPPCPLRVQPVDFDRANELIERGYEDSGAYLDSVAGRERAAVPFSMSMHAHSA
jgi:NTE family protein